MDMTGEYRIAASRREVWAALNDPEVLRQCIPGCEELERLSDTEMAAKVTAKIGPVKARFAGGVTLSDIAAPESYIISGEGKGGAAGFAKGSAKVRLVENAGDTVLHYEAHAQVGGKLAQLGTRLVGGTAKKMADDFFGRFSEVVAPAAPEIETVVAGDSGEAMAPRPVPPAVAEAGPSPADAMTDVAADGATRAAAEEAAAAPAPAETRRPAAPAGAAETEPEDTRSGGPLGLSPKLWILGILALAFALIWAFAA
jgi:hypothetical protein